MPRVTWWVLPSGVQPWLRAVATSTAAGERATPLRHPEAPPAWCAVSPAAAVRPPTRKPPVADARPSTAPAASRVARIDVGEGERHYRRREPIRLRRREVGAGVGSPREETVAARRQVEEEGRRPGLPVVLFAGRDHPVSGRGYPVLYAGPLPQDREHLALVRREGLGRVEESEPPLRPREPVSEGVRRLAPAAAEGERGRERLSHAPALAAARGGEGSGGRPERHPRAPVDAGAARGAHDAPGSRAAAAAEAAAVATRIRSAFRRMKPSASRWS